MENTELDSIIEKYKELKFKNYEIENNLRTLIKAKEKFPEFGKDQKWIKQYRQNLSDISEEMECYKIIKDKVSNEELQEISYDIKAEIFKKIYYDNNLDRFDMRKDEISAKEYNIQNTGYLFNNLDPEIKNEENFDKSKFANMILGEKNFLKKLDLAVFLAKKDNNFFDTSVIYKAEITKLFVNKMQIEEIDENEVITAAIMYTCKKVDSAREIERIKKEKNKDFEYLKSLGFSDRFCKICLEHTRYNQPEENYEREPEGDILELVENYVGLTMHREDRMAFPIDEAIDLIENKNLQGKYNRYLNLFKEFVEIMEEIRI